MVRNRRERTRRLLDELMQDRRIWVIFIMARAMEMDDYGIRQGQRIVDGIDRDIRRVQRVRWYRRPFSPYWPTTRTMRALLSVFAGDLICYGSLSDFRRRLDALD
jgi:hypothetical protein